VSLSDEIVSLSVPRKLKGDGQDACVLVEGIGGDRAWGQEDQKKAIGEGWERINRSGGWKVVGRKDREVVSLQWRWAAIQRITASDNKNSAQRFGFIIMLFTLSIPIRKWTVNPAHNCEWQQNDMKKRHYVKSSNEKTKMWIPTVQLNNCVSDIIFKTLHMIWNHLQELVHSQNKNESKSTHIYIYIYRERERETWCHCQRLYRSVWELTSCFLFPRSFLVLYRHGPFKDCTNYIELSNLSKSCFTWVIVKDCPTKPKDSTLNCFSFHPNTECHWITN